MFLTWFRRLNLTFTRSWRVLALAKYQLTRGAPLARPAVCSEQCRIRENKKLLIEFKVVTNTNTPAYTVARGELRENTFAFFPSEIKVKG